MITYYQRNMFNKILKFPFSRTKTNSNKFFISENELDSLISQSAKVRIGVMTKPIFKNYHADLLEAKDDNYTFYYKMTDPSQTEMQIVEDPELKALAVSKLKRSLDTVLHVPFRFYSWVCGPQNFVDFSVQRDKQRLLEYMDLVELEPVHSTLAENKVKQKLGSLDGVILPGGLNYPYEPMSSEEFVQHYEPSGKPKTHPKYRKESEIFKVYKNWISEIININSTGQFLPAWNVCLSLNYLPLVVGSSQLNWDSFGNLNSKLTKLRKIEHESLLQQSKQNSLLEMTNSELKEFEEESLYFHFNKMGFCVSSLMNDSAFMSQFDLLYTSSQNNFESPTKPYEDPHRFPWDRYYVNPDSLNPEFVSMLEHKEYPIYGIQFHPEVILRYVNDYKHPDIDRIREANVLFSKFYISMILRKKLGAQNFESLSGQKEEQYVESDAKKNPFKYFLSTVEEVLPDFKKKIAKEYGRQEYYQNQNNSEHDKLQHTDSTEEDKKLECLSSMAVALKGAGYNHVGLFWK